MLSSVAKRQIEIIDEQWKANHIEAMSCWSFQDLLLLCIETFDRINREDEGWRQSVFSGKYSYSSEEENVFVGLYTNWLETCKNFLAQLSHFKERGYSVECAVRFYECIREAEGILTPDTDFYVSDTLVCLRDKAIDEHRRGEVEDVGGQG